MAIQNGFFKSINGDRKYLAEFFTSYFASFIGNGVFPNPSTNLQVINNQNFSTIVRPGKGWINGHYLNNDDNIVINHQPPDGVLRRIDRIVFSVNLDSRSMDIYLKQGTPSSSAVAPALIRNSTLYELALADVAFNPGMVSISQSNITDQRMNKALCGIVHGVVEQLDTTTLFNQYQQFLVEKGLEFDQQLAVNQETFDTWFAELNDILNGDVAANLANMIITHTNNATPQKHIEVVNSIPQNLANKGLLLLVDDVDNPNNPPEIPTSIRLSNRIDEFDQQLMQVEEQKADLTLVDEKLNDISISQINKNKGLIDETYLSDSLKQQIAGDTPISVVPADNSITRRKIAFNAVEGKKSINLFNKDEVEYNKYLNANTGQTSDLQNWFVSDFIEITPTENYLLRPILTNSLAASYDENFNFISNVGRDITAPINSKFLRFSAPVENINEVQLQQGTVYLGYSSYSAKVTDEVVEIRDLSGDRLGLRSVPTNRLEDAILSKNLFNKDAVTLGFFAGASNGNLLPNANYLVSDYIEVLPGQNYTRSLIDQIAFYAKDKKTYVGGTNAQSVATITAPLNSYYMRVSMPITQAPNYQIEAGDIRTSYQRYEYELKYLKRPVEPKNTPLYTFADAWAAWRQNQKFPIGFLGDSTTDGTGTTAGGGHETQDNNAGGWGRVDYINQRAYPYLLEQLIKQETGQTAPRVYNIGYAGTEFSWAAPKLEQMFSGVYSDIKMIGITYGINDRVKVSTPIAYTNWMRDYLKQFIEFFLNKNIQPFVMTSQATVEPYDAYNGTYPLRTAENINSIANRVKRELAKEYGLEIIERTDFDEHALIYSQPDLTELINDTLHFGNIGHQLSAGYIFSQICPRVITVKDDAILGFSSQKIKSTVPSTKTALTYVIQDGFKVKADYTKANTNDMLLQDFWVLNYSKKQLNLTSFITNVHAQYVKVNGVNTNITNNNQLITTLDIGLHRIQAFTGANSEVDFVGFKLS